MRHASVFLTGGDAVHVAIMDEPQTVSYIDKDSGKEFEYSFSPLVIVDADFQQWVMDEGIWGMVYVNHSFMVVPLERMSLDRGHLLEFVERENTRRKADASEYATETGEEIPW